MPVLRLFLAAAGAAVAAVYLTLAWRRGREKRRRWRQDLCPECGYDLRGSSERCPECGRPIRRFPRIAAEITVKDERK
jgi:predicted amidophosphoribosyltransferase